MALQPIAPPNLAQDFESEWTQAQSLYNDAITKGADPQDAASLYLQPVTQKWKTIQSSPALLQNPQLRADFNTDFDKSLSNFHKAYNQYSEDNGQLAYSKTLQPTLQKWDVESQMPQPPAMTPQMEASALKAVSQGESPLDVVAQNPQILIDPNSRTMWSGLIRTVLNRNDKGNGPENPLDKDKFEEANAQYKKDMAAGESDDVLRQDQVNVLQAYGAFNKPQPPAAGPGGQPPVSVPLGQPQLQPQAPLGASTPHPWYVTAQQPGYTPSTMQPGSSYTVGKTSVSVPYKTPDDVKAAYDAGRIDRATAKQLLQQQFGNQFGQ